ncbi:MAG: hypothetical protein DRO04_01190 [Candidatus Iainarchaeum archaeon]|uniref:Uncharacterized protein n=1 Tax=Candidatus Iainarchaeum sp. TaxID=3101447 RepID=A0A497JID0_9ARCH|nr:MAG: hypothetical protein DRO04_01190 [Candidatus Diapherotrites archaeon]
MEQENLLQLVKKMKNKGASKEEIIQTLKGFNIEAKDAEKLLLLAEGDTYSLLKGEISKIVNEELERSKAELKKFIEEEAKKQTEGLGKAIAKQVKVDIEEHEKRLLKKSSEFEGKISDTVAKVTELSDRVRIKLNDLAEQVASVRMDLDELKISGISVRNRLISILLILFGLAFIALDLYRFVIYLNATMSIDAVITTVIYAFIGLSLMFLATQL